MLSLRQRKLLLYLVRILTFSGRDTWAGTEAFDDRAVSSPVGFVLSVFSVVGVSFREKSVFFICLSVETNVVLPCSRSWRVFNLRP